MHHIPSPVLTRDAIGKAPLRWKIVNICESIIWDDLAKVLDSSWHCANNPPELCLCTQCRWKRHKAKIPVYDTRSGHLICYANFQVDGCDYICIELFRILNWILGEHALNVECDFYKQHHSPVAQTAIKGYITYTICHEYDHTGHAMTLHVGFLWRRGVLFNQEGFFDVPDRPWGSLASSRHRGFFECNTMVGVCLSTNVGMVFLINLILAACHIVGALLN